MCHPSQKERISESVFCLLIARIMISEWRYRFGRQCLGVFAIYRVNSMTVLLCCLKHIQYFIFLHNLKCVFTLYALVSKRTRMLPEQVESYC